MPNAARFLLMLLSALSIFDCGLSLKRQHTRKLYAQQSKSSAVKPDYSLYLHKDELLEEVRKVVDGSPIMEIEGRTGVDGNYSANLLVVTVDAGGLKTQQVPKAKFLLDFGEHGREFVSSELALHLLKVLSNSTLLEETVGNNVTAEKVKKLLTHTVLKVIPMENENGRAIVENGDFCYRKNGREVDPNRNWDIDWGKKEKDYMHYEEYPGTRPFSEPEVQVLLNLTKEFQPHVWLNVHSGMEALFTPYDHKPSIPEGKESEATIAMMNDINSFLFNNRCAVGSGGKSVGYLAHGTATDYMYVGLQVPISLTWEIYGDTKAMFHDCFKMFNPQTAEGLQVVLRSWTRAILRLLELLPMHPSTGFLADILPSVPSDTPPKGQGSDGSTPSGPSTDTSLATTNPPADPASSLTLTKPTQTDSTTTSTHSTTTSTGSTTTSESASGTPATTTSDTSNGSSDTNSQSSSSIESTSSDSGSSSSSTPTATSSSSGVSTATATAPTTPITTDSSSTSSSTRSGSPHTGVISEGKPQLGGSTGSRKEGPSDDSGDASSATEVAIVDSTPAQSQLIQGAKLAGVWTLTVALVGLVGVLTMAARFWKPARH